MLSVPIQASAESITIEASKVSRMNNIRSARRMARMSQAEAARHLGVTQTGFSAWERGVVNIDTSAFRDMSRLFGVSMSYLIGGTDDPTPAKTASEKSAVRNDGLTLDLSILTEKNRQRVAGFVAALLLTQDD